MNAKDMAKIRFVASSLETALKACGRDPKAIKEYALVEETDGTVILFAVLDVARLSEPLGRYASEEVLHQISTNTRGLRVAISNHSGFRYAVLLSQPPKLPKSIEYPALVDTGVFPLGVTVRGPAHLRPEDLLNVLITGASRSGKSNFETLLAYAAANAGYHLYLADPQGVTFNDGWNGITRAPVASSTEEFARMLAQVRDEMSLRSSMFRTVTRPGGLQAQKLEEYNRYAPEPLPRVFVIVDEANTYLDDKTVTELVTDLARQSLKFGIHLALAAHSWRTSEIPRALSGQFATRVAFRTNDRTSAGVVLDDLNIGHAVMNIRHPGRGYIRTDGMPGIVKFQSYMLPDALLVDLLNSRPKMEFCPLTRDELSLAKRALEEADGKMTLAQLVEWGMTEREARNLVEAWEVRGWVKADPYRKNARYLTDSLIKLVDEFASSSLTKNEDAPFEGVFGQTTEPVKQVKLVKLDREAEE